MSKTLPWSALLWVGILLYLLGYVAQLRGEQKYFWIYTAATIIGCTCFVAAAAYLRHPVLGISACLFGIFICGKKGAIG